MEVLLRLPEVDLCLKLVALHVGKDCLLWGGSRDQAMPELVSVVLALLRRPGGEVS